MRKKIDLTGMEFEHLQVIGYHPRKTKGSDISQWLCRCECGNYLIVRSDNLRRGKTTQCSECKTTGGVRSIFVKDVIEDGVV